MGYDGASVVGQMAGRTDNEETVTPAQLIERFCNPAIEVVSEGTTVARGHCGYIGGRGDSMAVGFDDGYDWMGYLGDRGWHALASKGDWPYVVYLAYRSREPYAIAEYCEGDLTVWTFETGEAAQALYRSLKDCP